MFSKNIKFRLPKGFLFIFKTKDGQVNVIHIYSDLKRDKPPPFFFTKLRDLSENDLDRKACGYFLLVSILQIFGKAQKGDSGLSEWLLMSKI